MKHIFFVTVLLLANQSVFAMSDSVYDSEMAKMVFARNSAQRKIHGFQGCKNQKVCGFDGFYLAQYSPEGLCSDCEFNRFPDRFVACLFCRQPNSKIGDSKSNNCLMCCGNFKKLLEKKLMNLKAWPPRIAGNQINCLSSGTHRWAEMVEEMEARKYIAAFKLYETRSKVFKKYSDGIYLYKGVLQQEDGRRLHVWVDDFDIAEEDKKETTWNECGEYVSSICAKYNFIGPETGEVTLAEMPDHVSAIYEEPLS